MLLSILIPVISAVIVSPALAVIVTKRLNSEKIIPLLELSKTPVAILLKMQGVTIKSFCAEQVESLRLYLFRLAVDHPTYTPSVYVDVVTKLQREFILLGLEDDSHLVESYLNLFSKAALVSNPEHLEVAANIVVEAMLTLMTILSRDYTTCE